MTVRQDNEIFTSDNFSHIQNTIIKEKISETSNTEVEIKGWRK